MVFLVSFSPIGTSFATGGVFADWGIGELSNCQTNYAFTHSMAVNRIAKYRIKFDKLNFELNLGNSITDG